MSADKAAGATSGGVRGLVRALSLAEGFSLYLVVTPYAKHLTAVRQAAIDGGVAAGEVFNPYRISGAGPGLADEWPAAAVEQMLRTGTTAAPGPLWLDLTAAPGPTIGSERGRDDDGWAAVFHALNLGRNTVAKQLNRPLVVILPHRLSQLLAAEAPDLWSVRSAVVVLPADLAAPAGVVELPQVLVELPAASADELDTALAQVELARTRLAQDQAEVHVIALASAQGVAAGRLLEAGRKDEALGLAAESVELWRGLRTQRPSRFATELAESLRRRAELLESHGRRAQALDDRREAVELLRALAEERPGEFSPLLAVAMVGLGAALVSTDEPTEGLALSQAAVAMRREVQGASSGRRGAEIASGLGVVGSALLALGRYDEAAEVAREAVEIYRELGASKRSGVDILLCIAQMQLGDALFRAGRFEEALVPTREGVEALRELARGRDAAFGSILAVGLKSQSAIQTQLGQFDQAFASAGEALRLAIGDPLANREDFRPVLAKWLSSYLAAGAQAGVSVDTGLVAAVQARLGLAGAPAQEEA